MERRLAAILAADLVGYTRLMGEDELGTLKRLTMLRQKVIEPLITGHHGHIFKLIGDGLLVEFPSVVDAVTCAVAWQKSLREQEVSADNDSRLQFRIGINLGDVIIEDGDLYGDGVNIAARLESLAEPGEICVSEDTFRQLYGKLNLEFEDLGECTLKNVERPMRVYKVVRNESRPAAAKGHGKVLPLPDKPSIAVLPFINMSGDPDQDYFADGMVEDITTALSRMRWLFVIARNSSFIYKGKAVNVKQVGKELGVRYVLEGSVRKAGSKVRITGQLIDAVTGAHLWAEHFDGTLEDIFDLQDQVTARVVGEIAPRLEKAEIERAKRKPTESLDAYDYYLRGMAAVHQWEKESNEEALALFAKAVELDPNFAGGYAMAARCYSMRKASGWMKDLSAEVETARKLAQRGAELGKDDPVALAASAIALAFVVGELDHSRELIDQALSLDPNLAWGWLFSAWVNIWSGEPEEGIKQVEHAMRLSPHDPHVFNMQSALALAHFLAGRYDEALSWARIALRAHHHPPLAAGVAAASAAYLGKEEEAHEEMSRLLKLNPGLCLSNLKQLFPCRRPEHYAIWADGLRKAGLPE